MADYLEGEFSPLIKRGISIETCQKFSYRVTDDKEQKAQVADYFDAEGAVVGQKVRYPDKTFRVIGSLKQAQLFGQRLWRDKGKMVVVTEGELDAMSVSQVQDNKWPVVSIPNGAPAAKKSLAGQLEWLLGFETIVLMFDDDDAGRTAAQECAPLFPPGRCKIARIDGFKDASDALQAKDRKAIVDAIWGAKVFRPDGIVAGEELWEHMTAPRMDAGSRITLPWENFDKATQGFRRAELVMFLAGSGSGKTTVLRKIVVTALQEGETVGCLFLEEPVKRTLDGLIGAELGQPLHLDERQWADLPPAEQASRRAAFERLGGPTRLHLYDHFGSTGEDGLFDKLHFLAKGLGCTFIVLDHLSIVVSGMAGEGDERKLIDRIMTRLAVFTQETGCGLIVVSHLTRPKEGKGHEEGGQVRAGQARGSHAIIQLAHTVVGFERDQQAKYPLCNMVTVRLVKCRFTGKTGVVEHLLYDDETDAFKALSPQEVIALLKPDDKAGFTDEGPDEF